MKPRLGLAIGALAGAGFGIFEAVWVLNTVFASGWSWTVVETHGLLALFPFWERFFTVAFHIAASALAGYGLARGWAWQFYLIASFCHALVNYSATFAVGFLLSLYSLRSPLNTPSACWGDESGSPQGEERFAK